MQYYVQLQDIEQSTSPDKRVLPFESNAVDADEPPVQAKDTGIKRFLVLPCFAPVKRRKIEVLVNYSKSLIVTSASHMAKIKELALQREVAIVERIQTQKVVLEKRVYREWNKAVRIAEKQAQRAKRDALKATKQRERQTVKAVKEHQNKQKKMHRKHPGWLRRKRSRQ